MAMRLRLILCLLLCLLLCLALPLNGLAALAMQAAPCPMSDQHAGMAMDRVEDCCGEQSEGTLCESGQQCQSSSLLQVTVGKPALVTPGVPSPTRYSDFIPSPTPEGLWRPPRA